jgi:hypothetical protein
MLPNITLLGIQMQEAMPKTVPSCRIKGFMMYRLYPASVLTGMLGATTLFCHVPGNLLVNHRMLSLISYRHTRMSRTDQGES